MTNLPDQAPFDGDVAFAAALEECCRRVWRGEALRRCLADYPLAYRAELTRLVPLAGRVAGAGGDPAPEFQHRLEQRLLAAVDEARAQRGAKAPRGISATVTRPSLLGFSLGQTIGLVLAALVLMAAGSIGAVQASSEALPDHPLYRFKEVRNWVQLALARDGETRVGVHANQIAERGRELARAVQAGKPPEVLNALALRLAWSIERMVDQALELRARGHLGPANRALGALREMDQHLERLSVRAQPDARPTLRRLAIFLRTQEQRLARSET